TALIGAFGIGNGCGSTCTLSTQVVNQVEPLMKQNLVAAQQQAAANSGCLTLAEAQQLEANFNALWQQVVTGCNQVGGAGGSQCISDRQPGGKYDWTSYYLTPIQQLPICAQSVGLDGEVASAFSGSSLLVPIALVAAVLL